MPEAKFKVGDLVIHRGQQAARAYALAEMGEDGKKKGWFLGEAKDLQFWVVIESQLNTCSGGTQVTYTLRPAGPLGTSAQLYTMHECELLPAPTS